MERQNQDMEEEKKAGTSLLREILDWVIPFVLAMGAAVILMKYVIINAGIPTGSMENTIMPGDRLIGNRLAYCNEGPERGDVVIFQYPDNEEELYVKRVIGLPGETVDIVDGYIYINGSIEALEEDYLKEDWTVATGTYHFEIPEDAYLVLGDNRNDSWDARYWTNTYVYRDKILGKAVLIYWPIQHLGTLE